MLSKAEGEHAVGIAIAGEDPPDAQTNSQIMLPLRPIVTTTFTIRDPTGVTKSATPL